MRNEAHTRSNVYKPAVIRTIFHPTDCSQASDTAFDHALALALVARATLRIFHVSRDRGAKHGDDFPRVREVLERWSMIPSGSSRDVIGRLGVTVEKIVARGDPIHAIDRELETNPVELVVLAPEGRHGLPRWLEPSVAEPDLDLTFVGEPDDMPEPDVYIHGSNEIG